MIEYHVADRFARGGVRGRRRGERNVRHTLLDLCDAVRCQMVFCDGVRDRVIRPGCHAVCSCYTVCAFTLHRRLAISRPVIFHDLLRLRGLSLECSTH